MENIGLFCLFEYLFIEHRKDVGLITKGRGFKSHLELGYFFSEFPFNAKFDHVEFNYLDSFLFFVIF